MKAVKSKSSVKKQVSIRDVAKKAGVSIAAASYALNGRDGVAEKTRQRILAAVEDLGYHPAKFAQSMRTGKTDTIGLVLPDLSNPFFPQFAKAVQQSAGAEGKSVLLIDTSNDSDTEREGVKRLVSQGVDGIIWWVSDPANKELIEKSRAPVVLVDSMMPGVDSVTSDHSVGGRMVANLVNQSGVKNIGLIRGPENFRSASLRRDGFLENLDADIVVKWEEANAFSPPLKDSIKSLMARHDVDAVICPNDLIAIEVIRYLRSIGKQVPGDIGVTGFGDIQFADIISPSLTTVRQPLSDLGTQAVKLLWRRMATPGTPSEDLVLGVDLVVRESMKSTD